jgi:hypothetical protein
MEISYNFTIFNKGQKVDDTKNYYSLDISIVNFKLFHDSLYLNYNIINNDHPSNIIRVLIAHHFIGNSLFITATKAVKSHTHSSSSEK